jgi:site-specific DNA-adenine methylase
MFRYPGSKWNESAYIAKWIPADVTTYVEPFMGSAGVFRRLMSQGRSFNAVTLNDVDSSVSDFWHSVKDGSFFPKLLEARERLCPELFNEDAVRLEFENCKDRWSRNGDPFAWFFLRLYALGQFVQTKEDRKNIASFDPMYLGSGIDKQKPERWELIRSWLTSSTVSNSNALTLIRDLTFKAGPKTMVYMDPPYPVCKSHYKMYSMEMAFSEHRELARILSNTPFQWLLSMPFSEMVNDIYVKPNGFRTVLIPSKQSGHLGRCKNIDREYEWLVMPNIEKG